MPHALVGRIPSPLSGRVNASAALADNAGEGYEVAIAGYKFMLDSKPETPYKRNTAPYRKDQFDAEAEPGEQSLTGWWIRSQESFHGGAGILFQEPLGGEAPSNRFRDSMGIDVWTPGRITLLPATSLYVSASSTCLCVEGSTASGDVAFITDGSNASKFFYSGFGTTALTLAGGLGTIVAVAASPSLWYYADATNLYSRPIADGAVGTNTLIWNTGSSNIALAWVKQRLVAGIGSSVYELVGTGPALPTPVYTHPDSTWKWTAFAEGPTAIYASGYSGSKSTIAMFTLSSAGAMPTLTSAVTAADLPSGETVHALFSYLGKFLVIGTNKGVRVGVIQTDGSIQYGPLTIELPAGASAVKAFAGNDRFVYCGASNALPDGTSGLFRIDLSNEVEPGRFAWATDLGSDSANGQVTGIFILNNTTSGTAKVGFCIENLGAVYQEPAVKIDSGWLRTGRIRYRTLEPKLFKYVRIRTDVLKGTIGVEAINDADTLAQVITYSVQGVAASNEAAIPSTLGPNESFAFKFTLATQGITVAGDAPIMRSYQVKALPAAKPQRLITLPLLCFDREQSSTGQWLGHDGWAWERVRALEELEEAKDVIVYQRFGETAEEARSCVVEDVQFQETAPPSRATKDFGGMLMVTLRTID